jgi:hypothetical protein
MSADYPEPVFIEPDYRFFVNDGRTGEEKTGFVLRVLKEFANDDQSISEFMKRVYSSQHVAFSFIYGSALNDNVEISEIEDVDVFVATRNKKFVYNWDKPKGGEIRYHLVSEIKNHLKVGRRFFLHVFTKEFNTLGGIFANGLLAIKFSKELENIIHDARKNFYRIHIKALSQMVENDCRKKMGKRSRHKKIKKNLSSREVRQYAFYGSETRVSFDEARLMIDESLKRKNIQPGKAPAIARRILKRIKTRTEYEAHQLT